MILSEFILSRS